MYSQDLIETVVNRGLIEFYCKGGKKRKAQVKNPEGGLSVRWLGGHRKGVFVAFPIGSTVDEIEAPKSIGVGFALCKTKAGDEFDAMLAIRIAAFRAVCEKPMVVPTSMKKRMIKFIDRANRYFQNANIVTRLVFEELKNENTKEASDEMEAAD